MKDQLIIYIDRLRESPVRLELDIPPETLDLSDEEYQFHEKVKADVTFHLIGETDVIATGSLATHAEAVCVRCLEPARVALASQVSETWMKGESQRETSGEDIDDAPLLRTYQGDSFDASEAFRELIMAELPSHPVCSPDCRGLCPGCGVNLNEEPCQCSARGQEPAEETAELAWKQSLKKIHLDK